MQMLAIVILKLDRDCQVEKSDLQLYMTVWNGWGVGGCKNYQQIGEV